MKLKHIFFTSLILITCGLSWPFPSLFSHNNLDSVDDQNWLQKEMQIFRYQARNIDTRVLQLSLTAYLHARQKGLGGKPLLTVIDYSKPSSEKRLWVLDLRSGKTLFNTWVSHGKNSGDVTPTSFSNSPGSLKSSLGVFVTESPYIGGNGYSLRLKGLERGINDNAYRRDIVIHGAGYVNTDTIKRYGRVGRSWGCPAVSPALAASLINTIKKDSIVFAYYPDKQWLSHSQFLS